MGGTGMGGTMGAAQDVEVLLYATNLKEEETPQKIARLYSRVVMLLLSGGYEPVESLITWSAVVSTLKKHTVFTLISGADVVPACILKCLEEDGFTVRYYATQRRHLKKVDEIDIRVRHQRVLRHTERKISLNELEEIQL